MGETGVYGNRTHRELCSNPPLVLKTRAPTRGANTPRCFFNDHITSLEKTDTGRKGSVCRSAKDRHSLDGMPLRGILVSPTEPHRGRAGLSFADNFDSKN